jgi:hypothetical protein
MGGAAGHMKHPHEMFDWTLDRLVNFVMMTGSCSIPAKEKIDGLNLFVRRLDGVTRFARSKGELSSDGHILSELHARLEKCGARDIFCDAASAVDAFLNEVSVESSEWINLEVVREDHPITIDYSGNWLIFNSGDSFVESLWAGSINGWRLSTAVDLNPRGLTLFDVTRHAARLFQEFELYGLDESSTIVDYIAARIPIVFPESSKLSKKTVGELARKLCHGGHMRDINSGLPRDIAAISSRIGSSESSDRNRARVLAPIAEIFFDFGAQLLEGCHSAFRSDDPKTADRLRAAQQKLGIPVDDSEMIPTIEGAVYVIDGTMVKVTGSFARVSRVIGDAMFKKLS